MTSLLPASSLLRIEQLNYSYPSGVQALHSLSFEIHQGERVGLVGPSGAGKSTLLLHLNGLLPERLPEPDCASVFVNNQPVSKSGIDTIRQQVGLLFQNPEDQLFCPTVEEDVAFGPRQLQLTEAEVLQRVEDALAQANLFELRHRPISQLSYGQKKRACLAGLFACHPQLLALDEPFTGLDPRSRNQLVDLLLTDQRTLLVATHDLDVVVQMCDRVLLIDQGKLIADGPATELLGNQKLMDDHGLEVPLRLRLHS
ncbi:Cobalt import ATP-binding protein CbiO [Polystyrenella longa]|uniref:Cobalt import ATP-binding protein CbiO n=1 Tax=Polystyrenella longa TaxID=2528007 RepID=A0A518CPL6_9PLAN|nr:ABC transporter ATP-binding protein [Polystyrenella longa]QDU81158.1 Cobalt import ATP-binding protein CbiO [Polystyrenella longa]